MEKAHVPEQTRPCIAMLFMLGAYAFGFNLHSVIHEFGHSAAVLAQGGAVTGFYFHPFDACLNFSSSVPNHVLLYAGGAFFGGAATILFPLLAWRCRTPLMAPLVMACAAGLTTTARWMLAAPFSSVFTDYTSMIQLGFPPYLIALAGALYLAVGMGVLVLYLPLFGVTHEAGTGRRVAVFEVGILPYIASTSAWFVAAKGMAPAAAVANVVLAAVFLALWAALSAVLQRRVAFLRSIEPVRVRPAHLAWTWGAALVLIAIMRIVSTSPGGP